MWTDCLNCGCSSSFDCSRLVFLSNTGSLDYLFRWRWVIVGCVPWCSELASSRCGESWRKGGSLWWGAYSYCSVKTSYVRGRTDLPEKMRVAPALRWNTINGNPWLRFFIMIRLKITKTIFKKTIRGSKRHFYLRFAHLGRQGWSRGLTAGCMASRLSSDKLPRVAPLPKKCLVR